MIRGKQEDNAPSVARYFRRAGNALPYLLRTLSLIWRAAPRWTAAPIILLFLQGCIPGCVVYLTRPLVNGITAAVASGGNWRPILWPAALMGGALLLAEVLRGA